MDIICTLRLTNDDFVLKIPTDLRIKVPAAYPDRSEVDLSGPQCAGGCSHTSEIHVHPNGESLYVSNRGYDSIASFALDPATGSILSEVNFHTKLTMFR